MQELVLCITLFSLAKINDNHFTFGFFFLQIAEFTKECSAKWAKMNEKDKEPFAKKALTDKNRYDAEMAIYKGKDPNDAGKPKRPQSAYFCFLADFRLKMKGKDIDHKEIIKMGKSGEEKQILGNSNVKNLNWSENYHSSIYEPCAAISKKFGFK